MKRPSSKDQPKVSDDKSLSAAAFFQPVGLAASRQKTSSPSFGRENKMKIKNVSHTPGPWIIEAYGDQGDSDIVSAGGEQIATVYSDGAEMPEANADACLIAASVDLLEAAKMAYAAIGKPSPGPQVLIALHAAIAKAEGR